MESFTSARLKQTSGSDSSSAKSDPSSVVESPEKQSLNKNGRRIGSVNGDVDSPVTEAFVWRVCERIHGVIEAKLTPAQLPPIPTIPSSYPVLNYQAPLFYPLPYPTMSFPQVVYSSPNVSQPINAIPLTSSGNVIQNNRPERALDPNKKGWICDSNQQYCCIQPVQLKLPTLL